MAVGITTTDGKDLDDRYLKVDGTNGKAPNAVNAEYATNAGTAASANALNGTLPEGKLPTYGEGTLVDCAKPTTNMELDTRALNILGTVNCDHSSCNNGSSVYDTNHIALKYNTYGRVTQLGRWKTYHNCNCQCQD